MNEKPLKKPLMQLIKSALNNVSNPMFREFIGMYLALIALFFIYTNIASPLFFDIYRDDIYQDQTHDYAAIYSLLKRLYPLTSENEWQELLTEIDESSNIPIQTLTIDQLLLNDDQVTLLMNGELVIPEYPLDIHYQLIAPNVVAKVGPMGEIDSVQYAYSIHKFLPIVLFGGFTLLWIIGLQLRLLGLEHSMREFSKGQFNARASTGLWAIGALNHGFNLMAIRLKQYIQNQKYLTNAVSHEFRSPISRMRFQLEMALESTSSSERNLHLLGISDDLDEMEQMTHEILSYAKLESATAPVNLQSVNLHDWIIQQHAMLSMETAIPIELAVSNEEYIVYMDQVLMSRLVRNLVNNADKHTHSKIVLGATVKNYKCHIWVDDNGKGIPEEKRQTLFEPFTRLDNSRNKKTGGYGLGLAIVSKIAIQHGGHAKIITSPLGGARFLIRWPSNLAKVSS